MVEQHDGLGRLVSWACGLADHHAVLFVALVLQMQPLGELAKVVGDALLVVRGARNPVQLAEDAENAVGVDVVGCHILGGLIFLVSETIFQEISKWDVNDALIFAGIHEGGHRYYIFRVVVVNLLKVPEFAFES